MVNEKHRILRFLIENQEKRFSIRQIAKARHINYKTAYQNIKALEREDVVEVEKYGNTCLCSFNRNFNGDVFLVENMRKGKLLKNKNFKILYNRLEKIKHQFILLIFGSYVKKNTTKHSDIDILFISDNFKPVENELDLLPLKTHLTAISYNDFKTMLKSRELSVVSEVIKKNIILFGIEDYYRLIKNVE